MSGATLSITGASQVLTCGGATADGLGVIEHGDVLIEDETIVAVGPLGPVEADRTIDARGRVVMPGFVDCHTHVLFGGSRVEEYAAAVCGLPAPVGAPRGIHGTVSETRALGAEQLADQARPRLREMLAHGTTTVESKTGYGLRPAAELVMLEANALLRKTEELDLVSTYLGAHALPEDGDRGMHIDEVVASLPRAAEGFADFCDVYCDAGYFDLDETTRILEAGVEANLRPKLHLDAYSSTGAAALASRLAAVSVDHLNYTSDEELRELAGAGVVGVYLPVLEWAVAHPAPLDPKRLLDAGVVIALATDLCPGCYCASMQVVIQHACRTGGLSAEQAIHAATSGAARALGLGEEIGSIQAGKRADLLVLDIDDYRHLAYRIGHNAVTTVIKRGRVVVEATS